MGITDQMKTSKKYQTVDSDENSEEGFLNHINIRHSKPNENNYCEDHFYPPSSLVKKSENLCVSPSIEQVNSLHEPNNHNSGCDRAENKRRKGNFPKYMPSKKRDEELFDEIYQIPEGPKFEDQFEERTNQMRIYGGDGIPLHIKSFDQCNFSFEIKNNLRLRRYTRPLPIQACIIPLIQYKDHDIVGHAKTGSGKTAAFMLPIVNEIQLFKEEKAIDKNSEYPLAILIAPTKELAEQLYEDIRSFAQGTNVNVFLSFGDMPLGPSIREMRKDGCDIFVGTCGRVRHFVKDEIVRLNALRYFILDEADKLLRESFFDEIVQIKRHQHINPSHRTLLFSATFEDETRSRFEDLLHSDYFFVSVGELNRAVETVKQKIIEVSRYKKYDVLIELLKKRAEIIEGSDPSQHYAIEKTIIFAGQKRRTDRIAIALALQGFSVISTNGDRTLQQRNEAKNGFVRGEYDILVATDVFGRGLNVPHVSHVINFDVPQQEDLNYIHRIGRAGRAGNIGRATTFFDCDSDIRHANFYYQVLKDAGQTIPQFLEDIVENQKLADEEMVKKCLLEDKDNGEPNDIWC